MPVFVTVPTRTRTLTGATLRISADTLATSAAAPAKDTYTQNVLRRASIYSIGSRAGIGKKKVD